MTQETALSLDGRQEISQPARKVNLQYNKGATG